MKHPALFLGGAGLCLLASFVPTALAIAVFKYEATDAYTTSSPAFARSAIAGTTSGGGYKFKNPFDPDAPLSPATNYSGPVFYGGYEFYSSTLDGGFNRQQIRDHASPGATDQICLQTYRAGGWSGSTLSMHGLILFPQDAFANGYRSGDLSIDTLSVDYAAYGNADPNGSAYNATGRFVVQIDGTRYVSQSTFPLVVNGVYSRSAADLAAERWAPYDPVASLNFDQTAATFAPLALDGATAAGVYFEDDYWSGSASATTAFGFAIRSFEVGSSQWTTSLYRDDWQPVHTGSFEIAAFIQDYSYAGYARGETDIPSTMAVTYDVTASPYNADPSGVVDSTAAIQAAIDAASGTPGGGIVTLPAGTYKISPPTGKGYCLKIASSDVVLRGAGSDATFLLNTATSMRGKTILYIAPSAADQWNDTTNCPVADLTEDILDPTFTLRVSDTSAFSVGDDILIKMPATAAFIAEHDETAYWAGYESTLRGIVYHRTVTAVDSANHTLAVDIPLRYYLKTRDTPKVYRKNTSLRNIGVENLAIGNVQHPGAGWGELAYADPTKPAYEVHYSFAIGMTAVVDGWIRDVKSYCPAGNTSGCHLLANGIRIKECRNITLQDCHLQKPQYGGGGGNGYMYRLDDANECLLDNCVAEFSRHGFSIAGMSASGNVLLHCVDQFTGRATGDTGSYATNGKGSDHHMWLSHSNLYDGCTAYESWFEARDRWYPDQTAPKHNSTSAHTVFWNTRSEANGFNNHAVWSNQARYGYVIGTSGAVNQVRTDGDYDDLGQEREGMMSPVDVVEGAGAGDMLKPASLYLDQKRRRLGP